MIQAKVIAHSKNTHGEEIASLVVTGPRFILAEFNTHRMFSRNSASSRAIPFKKMLDKVNTSPMIPMAWQKEHKGMQGSDYIEDQQTLDYITKQWLFGRDCVVDAAQRISSNDVTKQLCNRLLEPFQYHTILVTATEWENFFQLRCPQYNLNGKIFRSRKDILKEYPGGVTNETEKYWRSINKGQGEIHIMALAEAMWDALNESTPRQLQPGEWHIPFGNNLDLQRLKEITSTQENPLDRTRTAIKIATARCARTSYDNFEGSSNDYVKDIELHDRLKSSGHMSPFEHCARAMTVEEWESWIRGRIPNDKYPDSICGWCRNFKGFIQYRAIVEENF